MAGNINLTNLPQGNDPVLGTFYGAADVTTAMAWNVNPASNTAVITTFLELLAQDPAALSGEWSGVKFDQYSQDRNVETVLELEGDISGFGDSNQIPGVNSQRLGLLAPNEKSGDENFRLGYTIHGAVSTASDIDVYEFSAIPGTQAWIDIDNTEFGLDSVIELIDINGNIIAISDNSLAEIREPSRCRCLYGSRTPHAIWSEFSTQLGWNIA